jgi:hypothetical protein
MRSWALAALGLAGLTRAAVATDEDGTVKSISVGTAIPIPRIRSKFERQLSLTLSGSVENAHAQPGMALPRPPAVIGDEASNVA